ncbi:AMP-binding protein [Rubritalea sp.]|uniref:AMP-binding protein n=1 Tax=Rubritalea sp. TaxID=2109375 RepID=UPI003EF4482B
MHNTFSSGEGQRLEQWLREQENPLFERQVFFQTSGSTGQSKWVALSKDALLASARGINAHLGIETGAKWVLNLPIFHVGGFGVLTRSFLTGGHCQVFHEKWGAVAFSRFVYEHGSEYISLVPTQVVDLVRSRCIAPHSVKAVVVGGGKLEDSVYRDALALGWPVLRSYGMTEAGSQIATGDNFEGGLNVLPIWETRVNQDGLLEWRGDAGLSFYLEEGEEGFRVIDPKHDGWFTTQDRVSISDGRLSMLGRNDSLVKVLGELVDIGRLEERLREEVGRDCVILTVPDERRGVLLVPVIESEGDVELPGFSGIERLQNALFLQVFPRTSLGKIRRGIVREVLGL